MNNVNKNNSNSSSNNSRLPLVIIGLVLLAAIAGGWWFYQNSKATPIKSNVNSANKKKNDANALDTYTKAPAGAQPPNMLGSPSASVTIEEFADFQCPTCAQVHSRMKEINALYGSRVKYIYRSFPLTQIHRNGYDAAVAAEAAGMQGKYWDMQNQLFTNQQAWANAEDGRRYFNEYAQKIGLDVDKFQTDMLGIATKGRVDADMQRGRALNISGTPTIYINGKPLSPEQFDVTTMRQLIDAELQKSQSGGGQTSTSQTTSVNPATGAANGGAEKGAGNSK